MLLKKIAKLGFLRLFALALMLVQNILLVRFMALEEIGQYYLMTTVAYLGNALIFVGADLHMQRQLAHLSSDARLNKPAFIRYVALTAATGGLLVMVAASLYFSRTAPQMWLLPTMVCTVLSMATYLSALGRNLCQIAAHPTFSNLGPITEGIFRAAAISVLAYSNQVQAVSVAASSAVGSLLAAIVTMGLLASTIMHRDTQVSYLGAPRQLAEKVMSVGASGVLNWAQLQGYRPLMMNSINGASVVGSVSFMSTLGSTAAYAVFTVLAQFQVPQQYSSQGASTARYLQLLAFVTLLLCMACLPVGAAFLWLTTKMQLLALVYLVAVGVLIEAGNSAIGACINHMNALDQRMWGLPFSGLLGCAVAFGLLVAPWPTQDPHLRVALALVAGQIVAVVTVLYLTYRTVKS